MSLIDKFTEIIEESKKTADEVKAEDFFVYEEINGKESGDICTRPNVLAHGENISFMKYLSEEKNMSGRIKLIYIDPPFFSKAAYDAVINIRHVDGKKAGSVKYFAYDDMWRKDMAEYLKMICSRLLLMKKLLADDGTIWIHLDWHVVHYVKVLMDEIFGEENFINEIIWHYKSGGSGKRHFARKHDTILVYSKTKKYFFSPPKEKSYNRGFKPYRFKGVKEYKDEMGWYTMVTMKDVWNVDMVGRTSSERTGYATQKPEALIERIISCATEEGDICADFFCGSGTLAATAEKMGRQWICCDSSPLAMASSLKRTQSLGAYIHVMQGKGKKMPATQNKLDVNVEYDNIAGSDKKMMRITLSGYDLGKIPEKIDEKGKTLILEAAASDPLCLIEYWSVDLTYDGNIFSPQEIFSRERGRLPVTCEKIIAGDRQYLICIKAVDIFGNSSIKII